MKERKKLTNIARNKQMEKKNRIVQKKKMKMKIMETNVSIDFL